MVDGTSPSDSNDAASSADATPTEAPGQQPASAATQATPAEGSATPESTAGAQSTNPVNASAPPASRRGLSKLAAAVVLLEAVLGWFWSDLDGRR